MFSSHKHTRLKALVLSVIACHGIDGRVMSYSWGQIKRLRFLFCSFLRVSRTSPKFSVLHPQYNRHSGYAISYAMVKGENRTVTQKKVCVRVCANACVCGGGWKGGKKFQEGRARKDCVHRWWLNHYVLAWQRPTRVHVTQPSKGQYSPLLTCAEAAGYSNNQGRWEAEASLTSHCCLSAFVQEHWIVLVNWALVSNFKGIGCCLRHLEYTMWWTRSGDEQEESFSFSVDVPFINSVTSLSPSRMLNHSAEHELAVVTSLTLPYVLCTIHFLKFSGKSVHSI